MYKNVKNELPTNTFECIVKMWNKFNDTWVTGIGIYDVPTKQWEIQDNGVVVNYPVHFWFKTPELDESIMNEFDWTYKIEEAYILPKDSYIIVMEDTPDHLEDKFISLYGWELLIDTYVFDNNYIKNTVIDGEKYILVVYPPNYTKDIFDFKPNMIEWDNIYHRESIYDKYIDGGFEEVTEEEFMRGIII